MSNKRRKHKINLQIGKFYRVNDGSCGGHPGQIFKIDEEDRAFYCVLTGSMSYEEFEKYGLRKGYLKLRYPTDINVDISIIKKRPFIGDRNDYGEKEYNDMKFNPEDLAIVIKVQGNNPIIGSYYRKRKKIKKLR